MYDDFFSPDAVFAINTSQSQCRQLHRLLHPQSGSSPSHKKSNCDDNDGNDGNVDYYEDLLPWFEKIERELIRLLVDPYLRFIQTKEFAKLEQQKRELFADVV
eukprot:gb/GECH01010774.1/.p1 GENE.gb/GECH01010774.1/~~gb/GECH01010774.1/.p1  ORF type:complete len:103 (+),score=26.34 gb/GECH01010774.1/:1-309(+)